MQYRVAYDKALEISKDMGESLLQRVNFFLIGTAFLIAGLATLVATSNDVGLDGYRLNLAYAINALGLYLALFFAVINSLTMAIMADFSIYIKEELEQELMAGKGHLSIATTSPFTKAEEITNSKLQCFPWQLLLTPFRQFCLLFADPEKAAKVAKTHHALLLPILLVIGWLVIFFSVLPIRWYAVAAVFGVIGFFLVIYALIYLGRYLRCRRAECSENTQKKKDKMRGKKS